MCLTVGESWILMSIDKKEGANFFVKFRIHRINFYGEKTQMFLSWLPGLTAISQKKRKFRQNQNGVECFQMVWRIFPNFCEKIRQNRQLVNEFRPYSLVFKFNSEYFWTLFVLISKGFQNSLLLRAFLNLINRKSHKWRNVAQSRNTEFD